MGSARGLHAFVFDFDQGMMIMTDENSNPLGTFSISEADDFSLAPLVGCFEGDNGEFKICAHSGGQLWLHTHNLNGRYQKVIVYNEVSGMEM